MQFICSLNESKNLLTIKNLILSKDLVEIKMMSRHVIKPQIDYITGSVVAFDL